MGQSPASFCLFSSFSHYNFNNTSWKRIDGVLGIWTQGGSMAGSDNTAYSKNCYEQRIVPTGFKFETSWVQNGQCNQFGRLLKVLDNHFSCISSPIIWCLFGLFWKVLLLSKKLLWLLLGQRLYKLNFVLIQHLVTLKTIGMSKIF